MGPISPIAIDRPRSSCAGRCPACALRTGCTSATPRAWYLPTPSFIGANRLLGRRSPLRLMAFWRSRSATLTPRLCRRRSFLRLSASLPLGLNVALEVLPDVDASVTDALVRRSCRRTFVSGLDVALEVAARRCGPPGSLPDRLAPCPQPLLSHPCDTLGRFGTVWDSYGTVWGWLHVGVMRSSWLAWFLARARVLQLRDLNILPQSSPSTSAISLSLADVLRRFGARYRSRMRGSLPEEHRTAMRMIEKCRTPALGGHVLECATCEGEQGYAFNSCNHRSCPKCMREASAKWVAARHEEVLPVPYFHVVFTVPQELNAIVRDEQRKLYPLLMKAAGQALVSIGKLPENLGATPAVMTSLHTSSNTLVYHLHVHCLVSAGGLDGEGNWKASKSETLAPTRALGARFRSRVLSLMKSAVKDLSVPEAVLKKDWQVYLELPHHGTPALLEYLSRPLHCGPLSEYRLESMTDEDVVFRYQKSGDRTWRTMRLSGHEFLRRFLQHVWPSGVHRVHYCGLWRRRCREQLRALRALLLGSAPRHRPPPQ